MRQIYRKAIEICELFFKVIILTYSFSTLWNCITRTQFILLSSSLTYWFAYYSGTVLSSQMVSVSPVSTWEVIISSVGWFQRAVCSCIRFPPPSPLSYWHNPISIESTLLNPRHGIEMSTFSCLRLFKE